MKVAILGPWFSRPELEENESISNLLINNGISNFLPQRDMPSMTYIANQILDRKKESELAFNYARELYSRKFHIELKKCGAAILNYNGRVPYEGAVFCAGMFYSSGKPVVIYKNDNRSFLKNLDSPEIAPLQSVVKNFEEIIPALNKLEGRSQKRGFDAKSKRIFQGITFCYNDLGLAIDRLLD